MRGSRAAARKGQSPVEHRGNLSVCLSIRLSVHPSVCPPPTPFSGFCLHWGLFSPKFCQIAQIQAIRPKSKQNGQNPSIMAQIQQNGPTLARNPNSMPRSIILAPLGSGLEGDDDLCFHTYGKLSPSSSPPPSPSPSPPHRWVMDTTFTLQVIT